MISTPPTLKAYDRLYQPITIGSTVEWSDGAHGVVIDIVAMTEGATLQVIWEDGALEYVTPNTVQLV